MWTCLEITKLTSKRTRLACILRTRRDEDDPAQKWKQNWFQFPNRIQSLYLKLNKFIYKMLRKTESSFNLQLCSLYSWKFPFDILLAVQRANCWPFIIHGLYDLSEGIFYGGGVGVHFSERKKKRTMALWKLQIYVSGLLCHNTSRISCKECNECHCLIQDSTKVFELSDW